MNEPTIYFSGHLAAKPELRAIDRPEGPVAVAHLRVAATPRRRGRGADEWVDGETIWFNVSVWRGAAANCVSSLNQGDRVAVRGRLTQRTWKDADGVERPSFAVDADDVALDISRHAAMSLRQRPPAQRQEPAAGTGDADRGGAEDPDGWESTGRVDLGTGEVLLEQVSTGGEGAGDGADDDEHDEADGHAPVPA